MTKSSGSRRRGTLKRYEWMNILVLLSVVVALAVFGTWVFRLYSRPDEGPAGRTQESDGIVSEVVLPDSDTCMFTLGTTVAHTSHRYAGPTDVRLADDGLVQGLFTIPGVLEVVVHPRSIALHKAPSARWDNILPRARTIISSHLHIHQ